MVGQLYSKLSLGDPGSSNTVSLPPSTGLSSPALLWLSAVIANGKGEERTPRARDFLLSKSGEMKLGCLLFANIPLARDEPHGQI